MAQTPEGRVKNMVRKMLDQMGGNCYRFMPVQTGLGSRTLDFLLCVNGYFVGLETKAPGKHLTPLQRQTKAAMEAAGALVFEVSDEESLEICRTKLLQIAALTPPHGGSRTTPS